MSTTTAHLNVPATPWKSAFHEHLSHMDSPEFVFTSLHPAPSKSPTPYLPRARFCIYRGMWAELPDNKHNNAPMNSRVYESDMPTFTTDVRMEKVGELFSSSAGHADKDEQIQGCGGGGPCEAVFWMKDVGMQWRFKGSGWIVGPDVEAEPTSGVRTLKSEVGRRMKIVDSEKHEGGEWSWAKELTAHFGNCSPGMRGSWKNPPPGTPTHGKEPDPEHQVGQKVEDLNDEIARSNFRVVVIKPDEVEKTDLSDPAKARRTKYTFVVDGDQGRWESEELWP